MSASLLRDLWTLGWGALGRFFSIESRLHNVAWRLGLLLEVLGRGNLQTLSKLFAFHEVLLLCGGSRQNQDWVIFGAFQPLSPPLPQTLSGHSQKISGYKHGAGAGGRWTFFTGAQEEVCKISCSLGNHPGCLYWRSFYTYGAGCYLYSLSFSSSTWYKSFQVLSCTPRVLKPRLGNARGWSMSGFQRFVNSWRW